ncbi:MAG TPA: toll/interleukin-1 receptor domain-containing protein [Terrimicrobiaceae bacterium]
MSTLNANVSGRSTQQPRYNAFLSHNGADKALVEELAYKLEERGLACWLDKWNLVPGDPWQPAIEEALGYCDTCVVFFGPNGLGPWHNEEMRLAIQRRVGTSERKLRILPVILPGGQRARESDVPGFLQGTTWVRFAKSIEDEDALHLLECGIRGVPPGRRAGATISEGECPYLGLKTFQPRDAPLFFGRTAKIEELVYRLRDGFGTPREERFLALIGASGSGKSSLALAGLIPAIQRGELPESAAWPMVRCRPGAHPWESLQIALAANQQIAPHFAALPALIVRPEDEQRRVHLATRLALQNAPETHRVFVLIDQFEETFALCRDEVARRSFIDNLLYATSVTDGRAIVVLTMRADFYGQCASHPGLRAAISDHQSLIGPLSEMELRDVIENPAQMAGGELEPGLMELLLADMAGQPGALPFLGDALFKLWENRDGRRLTAKAYTDMGRLVGALDTHAEQFFTKELTLDEQTLCHQLLLDLVHPGEGAADTKKRVGIDDVAFTEAARALLKKLADARLVTTSGESKAPQVELAHEALISGWRRLGNWVNENREKTRLKERLLDSAREWQQNGKGGDFLYRGTQLAAAEESFGSGMQFLAQLAREFLEASVAERNRERAERQRQRAEDERQHQRELENQRARAKAEEERAEAEKQRAVEAEARRKAEEARADAERRYAEKQTRAAFKMRRLAKILGVLAFLAGSLAFLAVGGGIFAFWQKAEADRSRTAAEETLRKSFERTIGVSQGDSLSADERAALWELSELDINSQNVRRMVIDSWMQNPDYMVRALSHDSRGLHAAIGLNAKLAAYFNSRTDAAANDLAEALEKQQKADSDRLSRLGSALAILAGYTSPGVGTSVAARGASVLTEALRDSQEMDSARLWSLSSALAALAARMDPNAAASAANTLAEALEDPKETDPDRLSRLGSALAALAAHVNPNVAARVADRLAKALADPKETDPDRLSRLGSALAAIAVHMDRNAAGPVALSGALVLANALEYSKDSDHLWNLGKALSELAVRMEPKDAAIVAEGVAKALENPKETSSDRLWSLGKALMALAARMDPKDATSVADGVAKALENPNETNSARLWCLGDVLAALATRMEPKDAARLADGVAKALENPKETNSARQWSLGKALAALAARMEPDDAALVADGVAKALEEPLEMDSLRLSGFGDALAALAIQMNQNTATDVASRGASVLAKALENPKETDSVRLSRVGSALAALAAHMDHNNVTSVAARGASVLTRALGNPKETDSDRLSRLGGALAALATKFDSGSQTQLVALSNLFLGKVSPRAGKSREEEAQDRKRIETVCQSLSTKELAGVLKWPLCVGETQKLVFTELKRKIGRPFDGDLSKFVEQVDLLSIDGVDQKFLNQPAKRPKTEDALRELGAI